ncbi:MurR/RpiR family transcriptional regulator [Thermosipho atlanticus]|uniref:Transcriptional regulator, RpiR family n=1 Tax=Thermosipho atlanticus DSM 15807 TaxID=1123380 RepID=A0A1M5RBG5_9BACT|nr:MurR/RpiR family transcriptional regulator [Thermosipho atlanticus]SHH23645.1 transcriptional regulator, RpiR family [Thermosipho atlanticus DSM 15807]
MNKGQLTTFEKIKANYNSLSKAGKKLADFVLKNPEKVIRMSISELARIVGLKSESTVVKFYRNIGFSGYHDFKVSLAGDLAGKSILHSYKDIYINDSVDNVKKKFFSSTIRAFHDHLEKFTDKLLEEGAKILSSSNRIICLGYGASAAIAKYAAFRFSVFDKEIFFSEDSHFNALILRKLKENDCIIAISYSGETKDVIIPLEHRRGAKLIAITGNKESSLGKISDLVFEVKIEEISMRTDALISRYIQMAIIDILFTILVINGGEKVLNELTAARKSFSHLKF